MSTGTRDIAERIRSAAAHGTPLRIVSRGRWLHANRPVQGGETLSLSECSGIIDYVPGDLTLTARGGTPLAEIAHAARDHGQWLALDPWGGDDGSIGATVATASGGPHAAAFGGPRDNVLGVEFVTGAGDVVRGGGRVVKNVAGFDLTRLLTGAWGTLGVITEVTVRLRALPVRSETIAVTGPAAVIDTLGVRLRALPAAPYATELVSAELAARLGLARTTTLLVRTGGNEESVRAQREDLRSLGDVSDVDESVWRALRIVETPDCAVWRFSQRPSAFGATWRSGAATIAAAGRAWMHGNPLRGVVRCVVPGAMAAAALPSAIDLADARAFAGTRIAEVLPTASWAAIPGAAQDALSRRIRRAFDPHLILNRGILGEAS